MNKEFHFSLINKVIFNLSYLYYKIFLLREVKEGVLNLYLAEFLWLLKRVFGSSFSAPKILMRDYYETKFGKYYITSDLVSTITVSPAFERLDINYLLKLIGRAVKEKRKVLFIDIGANFGLYTVVVGNMFKKKNIDIIAFEPDASYISSPTYGLLKKNIEVNNLKNVKLYKIGIGIKYENKKNKEGFNTKTLDKVLGKNFFKKYDHVFIKLDVDDFVVDALKGISVCVNNCNNVTLLIEDFVKKDCLSELRKEGYKFLAKLTTYNSFWTINK